MPRFGTHVFRGNPSEIIIEMASAGREPVTSAKTAIRHLVEDLTRSHKAKVQIPWEQPEGALAKAFLKALLQSGIAQPVPQA